MPKRIYMTDIESRKAMKEFARIRRANIVARDKAFFASRPRRTHFTPGALQAMTPEKFVKAVQVPGFTLTITGHRNHG